MLRFALPALLIILVLAGLRGATVAPGWTGRFHRDGVVVGIILEVVLAALLAVLLIRDQRSTSGTFVVARLRALLKYLLMAGLVVVPGMVVFSLHLPRIQGHGPQIKSRGNPAKLKPAHLKPPAPWHFPVAAVLYGLLVAVLIAGVVLCCVLVARRSREEGDEPDLDFGDESSELSAAVESGRSALLRLDDAQAAIIACYVAMEASLAQAGAARGVADTPDELLTRAVVAGLASIGAASRLTALFYEARFSTHPLGPAERDEAERALTEIAAAVSRPRAGADASTAPGATQ
ncbi:MAG TPA: DUF4129 domain-containing protein [Streptosporangiaceae bacterium]|nr:DUF4129 domain-containing protein [Streptosporangiaceae bacterium]